MGACSDVLDEKLQTERLACPSVALDVEHAERSAEERNLVYVLRALDHDELTRLYQAGLFGRSQGQEKVAGSQILDAADSGLCIKHSGSV
jgi:hypothetical protein